VRAAWSLSKKKKKKAKTAPAFSSTLKVWTLDGTPVQELIGHTAYVYSCAYSPFSGEIISGGEDRSLRVWLG